MKLPALLPEELSYCEEAQDDAFLLQILADKPVHLVLFFETACGNETWSLNHLLFMRQAILWLIEKDLDNHLEPIFLKQCASAIQAHYHVLKKATPLNVTCVGTQSNSLLLSAASPYLRNALLAEKREDHTITLELPEMTPFIMEQIVEETHTGKVADLWRHSEKQVYSVLERASALDLQGLSKIAQKILKRYLNRVNIFERLLHAHQNRWLILKKEAIAFLNAQNFGITSRDARPEALQLEFTDFTDRALSTFALLKSEITHLHFTENLAEEPPFLELITACPKLQSLNLKISDTFSDQLLKLPATFTSLNLASCPWLTDQHLAAILKTLPQLEKLSLASNPQIGFQGWASLHVLPKLTVLDISRCHQIGDEEFKLLMRACPKIIDLVMPECTRITESGFSMLAHTLKELRTLDLSRCAVPLSALVEIATQCPHLTELNLTRSTALSERELKEGVRHAGTLRKLILREFPISEETLSAIHRQFPLLEVVTDG